jgi:hypothetical protein
MVVGATVISVVWTVVGAGVATGAAGWEHPAASVRTMQSISVNAIVSILFIPDGFPGGYLRVLSSKVLRHGFLQLFFACAYFLKIK